MANGFKLDRNLALEGVRVTELTALAASRLMGRGDEKAADQAAVNAMRDALNGLPIEGTVVIGEGGSGGAIAFASANSVFMLEHSIYSVISPEGCASILWRSGEHTKDAAEQLKLTAQDLLKLKVIDQVVEEPLGGAQRDRTVTIDRVGDRLESELLELRTLDGGTLRRKRRDKYLEMGQVGLS